MTTPLRVGLGTFHHGWQDGPHVDHPRGGGGGGAGEVARVWRCQVTKSLEGIHGFLSCQHPGLS